MWRTNNCQRHTTDFIMHGLRSSLLLNYPSTEYTPRFIWTRRRTVFPSDSDDVRTGIELKSDFVCRPGKNFQERQVQFKGESSPLPLSFSPTFQSEPPRIPVSPNFPHSLDKIVFSSTSYSCVLDYGMAIGKYFNKHWNVNPQKCRFIAT